MTFKTKKIVIICAMAFSTLSYAQIIIQNSSTTVPAVNLNKQKVYEVYDPMTGKNKTVIQPIAGVAISTDNIMAKVAKDTVEILTGKPAVSKEKTPIEPPTMEVTLQNQSKTSSTQLSMQPIVINNKPVGDDKMLTPNNLTLPKKDNEIIVVDPYTNQQKTLTQKELDNANKSISDGKNTTGGLEPVPTDPKNTVKPENKEAKSITENIENKVVSKPKTEEKTGQDLPKSNIVMTDISSFNKTSIEQYENQSLINTNKLFNEFIKNNPSKPPMQIK